MKLKENLKGKKQDEKKKIVQISQEIELVQKLADNDVRMRDRAVKKLKNWLEVKTKDGAAFSKEDMDIIWRGLFYCMWNSDKPLVQEELCENISKLIHNCLNENDAILYVDAFFSTMRFEWLNIDNFRLPKYEMLTRRVLRQSLNRVAQDDWSLVGQFGKVLWEKLLKPNKISPAPIGLLFHVCEIFLQEVAKCAITNEVTEDALQELLRPFMQCLAHNQTDIRLRGKIDDAVLGYLIDQSDIGIEQHEKINAWKSMGCPAIDLDDIEKVEDEEEEMEDDENDEDDEEMENADTVTVLDPRAGQSDVELPQLSFDPARIADMIEAFYKTSGINSTTKRYIKCAAKKFKELAGGTHPVPFQVPVKPDEVSLLSWKPKFAAKRAAQDLLSFEQELMKDSAKNYKKNKNKSNGLQQVDDEVVKEEVEPTVSTEKRQSKKKAPSPKTEEPPAKKLRRRSSLGQWEVTKLEATPAKAVAESSVKCTSPSYVGVWNVSKVDKKSPTQQNGASPSANGWEKPLEEGEIEYFVAAKKSPKRRSLYKQPSAEEIAAEKHSPVHDGKENFDRSPHIFTFSPKNAKQETPKPSEKLATAEISAKQTPVEKLKTPERKARASMSTAPETPKPAKNVTLTTALINSAKKRVSIQLQHNKAQEVHEYVQQLRNSPHTPHDPKKQPVQGLLKGSPRTPRASLPFISRFERCKRESGIFQ